MKSELLNRIITSIFLLVIVFYIILNNFYLNIFLLLIFTISCFEFYKLFQNIKKKNNLKMHNYIMFNLISLVYLSFFCIEIYDFLKLNNQNKLIFVFILSVCILTDIGGLIAGKTIGGKKLTKISPNKTVAGSIGSFIFSFLSVFVFSYYFPKYLFLNLIFLAFFISLFSQFGDLLISLLKRKAKVKDTGNILPGHGGLLDRIDGMLLGLPFGIILFKYLN